MTNADIQQAIAAIKFPEIQAYLRNTGWQRVPSKRENVGIFHKQVGTETYEALLPLDRTLSDYYLRIHDVFRLISKAENRDLEQILTDFSLPPADIVRFRVVNSDTLGGTISIRDGFALLESAKNALFAIASDIVQPEKYHRRMALKQAQQFIDACRLGQTEKGSFIASIVCPFMESAEDESAKPLGLFDQPDEYRSSFTRKVTLRLMDSLQTIKSAIDNGEQDRLLQLDQEKSISGNFFESLAEFDTGRDETEIEIQTTWSMFAPVNTQPTRSVRFSSDYFPVIERVAERLRPNDEDIEDVFVGKISQVKADPDPHTRTEGEVIFNFMSGDAEKITKARVVLNKNDYEQACIAHKEGRMVKVTGRLIGNPRSKAITNAVFEVVE